MEASTRRGFLAALVGAVGATAVRILPVEASSQRQILASGIAHTHQHEDTHIDTGKHFPASAIVLASLETQTNIATLVSARILPDQRTVAFTVTPASNFDNYKVAWVVLG